MSDMSDIVTPLVSSPVLLSLIDEILNNPTAASSALSNRQPIEHDGSILEVIIPTLEDRDALTKSAKPVSAPDSMNDPNELSDPNEMARQITDIDYQQEKRCRETGRSLANLPGIAGMFPREEPERLRTLAKKRSKAGKTVDQPNHREVSTQMELEAILRSYQEASTQTESDLFEQLQMTDHAGQGQDCRTVCLSKPTFWDG